MNFFKKFGSQRQDPKIRRGKSTQAARKASSLGKLSIEPMQMRLQKPGLFEFTMMVLYKNLYLLGVSLLRRGLRFRRKLKKLRSELVYATDSRLEIIIQSVKRFFAKLWRECKAPFLRIRRTYIEVKPDIAAKRAKGKFPAAAYFTVLETIFRLIFRIFATVFNYTAPVAAVVIFVIIVGNRLNEQMVYTLQYKGEIIGYVNDKSEFNEALQDVRSRVTVDGDMAFEIESPHFELLTMSQLMQEKEKEDGKIPKDAHLLEKDELADTLIRMSGSEVDEAYGLYIDNIFLGALLEKDAVLNEFDRIRLGSLQGKPDEVPRIVKNIKLKPGLYPKESLVSDEAIISTISRNETAEEVYVVKEGDTPTGIADKTGVPYDVLKTLNPEIEDKLFEGMEIKTQVARPFLSVQLTYTDVVEEEVPFETIESQNATYARGYRDVYQTGQNGLRRVVYRVTSMDGFERDRAELSYEMITHPVPERVTVGINDPQVVVRPPSASNPSSSGTPGVQAPIQSQPSSGFIWPVGGSGGTITCYLNGYWGHTGIDIAQAGGQGTPILAAASGTVVLAKNTGVGYGRYLIIDHGNGYQTLYAHNSALYAGVGDRVAQGQVIAAMGRTGNAYGVHLHFEVRYQGRIQNPVNFVGRR